MKFSPIFAQADQSNLWAVHYPVMKNKHSKKDVFSILMDDLWSNPSYVRKFLQDNIHLLKTPFWNGKVLSDAQNQIERERQFFDSELYGIEHKLEGYEKKNLRSIFTNLHENKTSLNFSRENERKGKSEEWPPLLRLYGIEIENSIIIITGGAIKLTRDMSDDLFPEVHSQLIAVQNFLTNNNINDRLSLLDEYNAY